MNQQACQRLVLLLVLALGSAVRRGPQPAAAASIDIKGGANPWLWANSLQLASSEALRPLDKTPLDGSRHRRSLLAATQQISQCDWIQGEGCALHPAYASYALNRSSDDVVAQYVSNALACATATDKGLCESASYCYWDPSFSNGQQGCFLHDDALLSLQLRCVQQQYQPSLSKLQACMAARHSCQCTTSTSSGSSNTASCTQRQQQLLAGYGPSRDKVCSSLLGCWLLRLNSSTPDITQLVEAQLLVVQPKLESLNGNASSGTGETLSSGRRRALQQKPPQLSDPVMDDKSGSNDGYAPEAGSYGPGSGSSAAGAPSIGMNGVVTDDQAVAPVTTNTPVENGKNVPAPSKANGSSNANTSAGLQLEAGVVGNSDWALEQTPVDPDKVFGSGNPAAGSSSSTGSSSSSDGVQMSGGNAPASFWQCAADAAAKADTTRKWADIDYNSKTLTLMTWLKVIKPTSLIDWGVQVMECFKTEVPKLTGLDTSASSNSTKPNKESLEFAIVALIRAFSAQAEAFRSYLQAGTSAQPAASLTALSRLAREVFPGQLSILNSKYQGSPAYRRDVMLQAAAVITDLQWFAADVLSLASSAGTSSGQQEAFEAYITYSEEMVRRCLYWLFFLQFDGPPAHLPGPIPSSVSSTEVVSAFEGLAAATLPAATVAADSPAWQQLQVMMATAAGSAAAAAAQFGTELDSSMMLGHTVDGLARAHVQDLWGSRLDLARTGAPDASRQLALRDPNEKNARWEPLRKQQLAMLSALQERAALGRSTDVSANLRLSKALRELVAASGAYLFSGSDSTSAQQQLQQELSRTLGLSARIALLIRQCHGSPAGLPALPPAAATKAGIPAAAAEACTALAAHTEALAAGGQGGIVGSTLLADLDRQWKCNAVSKDACSSKPGCALALAPVLVPGTSASGTDSMVLSCQASDASLFLSSLDSSVKSALAVGLSCEQFLKLPACETVANPGTCSTLPTCRWELTAQRNVLHTTTAAAGASAAQAAAGAGSKGVCAMDWVAVLTSTGSSNAYSGLNSMIQLCNGIGDSGQCESQTMLITLDAPAPGGSSMARFWVPALVVAGVAGVLLFGAAIWWRQRSAAARRAAEEARAAAGAGRGGRRGGKDGKGAKATKKKPKRAEPGSYKPDLMRDSFTDYMRAAPQQFNNGVAIAKAAMATGDLDAAVAVADVAGGRQLASVQQQSGAAAAAMYNTGRSASPGSESSWGLGVPTGTVPNSQCSTDLIDLSPSDASNHHSSMSSAQPDQGYSSGGQLQQVEMAATGMAPPAPGAGAAAAAATPGSVWGSAAAAAGMGLVGSPGLVSPHSLGFNAGLGGRPPLHGDLSVPVNLLDANASIALTSSINLVSSLPQHSSLPIGLMPEQSAQQEGHTGWSAAAAPGAARTSFGAVNTLGRVSSSSLAASAYAGRSSPFDPAHSGSLLLPVASRGAPASEDGNTTPTSSCCHDSVCTFGPGPGSVAGSSSGARPASGLRSHSSHRSGGTAGGPGARGVAGSTTGPGGLSGAPSVPLSRSSWSSAMSTDLLMSTQHSSAILDP